MSSWLGSAQARDHAERIRQALEAARRNLESSPSRHSSQGYETPDDADSDDDQVQQIEALLHRSRGSSPLRQTRSTSRLSDLSSTESSRAIPESHEPISDSRHKQHDRVTIFTSTDINSVLSIYASDQPASNPFATRSVFRQTSAAPSSRASDSQRTSSERQSRQGLAAVLSSLGPGFLLPSQSPSSSGGPYSPPGYGRLGQDDEASGWQDASSDQAALSRTSLESGRSATREMKAAVLASLGPDVFLPPAADLTASATRRERGSMSPVSLTTRDNSQDLSGPVSSSEEHSPSPQPKSLYDRPINIPERRGSRTVDGANLNASDSEASLASNNPSSSRPRVRPPRVRAYQPPLRNPFRDSSASEKDVRPGYSSRKSSLSVGTPISYRDLGSDFTRYPKRKGADRRRSACTDLSSRPSSAGFAAADRSTSRQSLVSLAESLASTTYSSDKGLLSQSYTVDAERGYTPFLDDRLGAPAAEKSGYSYKMYHDEPEDDDEMHMPAFDDDVRHKPRWRDHFTRSNISSSFALFGLLFIILGIIVGLPVASGTGAMELWDGHSTPLSWFADNDQDNGPPWAHVNNNTYALFQNLRTGLVDPDTPIAARTSYSTRGEKMNLVFSDEFSRPNRSFYPGDDPFWYAPDFWYGSTGDIDWYSPENVNTGDGALLLTLSKFQSHGLDYLSGMLHSWNQTCFKGGKFEVGVSLPGPAGVPGLWPGAWSMGNLGRPGYRATTDGVWPYTYNECDLGITKNQSMPDGTSKLPGQRLSSCACPGSDHPTPGTGRGAPEIDIFEAAVGGGNMPTVTQSYQVAPFDVWYYPNYEYFEFPNFEKNFTAPNGYTGGPFQQALSATSTTNDAWFDGRVYQSFAYEYQPTSFTGRVSDSYIAWFIGDEMTLRMSGDAIGPNGNVGQRQISEEPMSLILNLGFSHNWGWIDVDNLIFPTTMRVDYVRWYQLAGRESVTCDPAGYETTAYIREHPTAYTNANLTLWDDAGYPWPQDSLTSDCSRPNHPAHPLSPAVQPFRGSDAGPGA